MKRAMSEQEINCLKTLLKDFDIGQIYVVLMGLEQSYDVSVYANSAFDFLQMEAIRLGLGEGLDAEAYADPELGWFEMKQIRESIKEAAEK